MAKKAAASALIRTQARKPTPHAGPSATVSLRQGRYTGVLLSASAISRRDPAGRRAGVTSSSSLPRDVEAWRGIPYAQTTAGENRFRPPIPLSPYDVDAAVTTQAQLQQRQSQKHGSRASSFTADRFGQMCPGSTAPCANVAFEGEDCLNLNVYRPVAATEDGSSVPSLLPVVIYVHGGAFNAGSGTERDMASFVGWAETPVLGVNFNYRVGALGFPSSSAADEEGGLNLGLRDQRMLFEWVRDNIAEFGGDPGRVTVMGMSAGAHSIGYHLQYYTDPATAPIHGAIMESGGATARATLSASHPRTETQWREFLVAAGVDPSTTPPADLFTRLRALPLDVILNASNSVFTSYQDPIRWPFQPVVESASSSSSEKPTIGELPIARFRRGEFLRVPVMTGFNTNEGAVFCSPAVGDTEADFLAKFTTMIPGLSTADLSALASVYPDPTTAAGDTGPYAQVPAGFTRQWSRYEAAYGHYAYICPVLQSGHFYSNGDGSSSSQSSTTPPVWVYHFAALSRPDLGGRSNHVDEAAPATHDLAALAGYPGLLRTSDAMHGAWVRFVATGNPNPKSTSTAAGPWWPRFTSPLPEGPSSIRLQQHRRHPAGQVMLFGAGNDERLGASGTSSEGTPAQVVRLTDDEVEQCRFWWERVELSEGMGTRMSGSAAAPKAKL